MLATLQIVKLPSVNYNAPLIIEEFRFALAHNDLAPLDADPHIKPMLQLQIGNVFHAQTFYLHADDIILCAKSETAGKSNDWVGRCSFIKLLSPVNLHCDLRTIESRLQIKLQNFHIYRRVGRSGPKASEQANEVNEGAHGKAFLFIQIADF